MGKKIDVFLVSSIGAALVYCYLYDSFQNRWIALALAFIICIVLNKLLRRITKGVSGSKWMRKRAMRKNADRILLNLACMDSDEAEAIFSQLIDAAYHETCGIALIQLHPSTSLSQNSIFECWKAHRGKDRLVICSTGRADDSARTFAHQLQSPRLALADAEVLSELIADHPEILKNQPSAASDRKRLRIRRFHFALINRKNAPRTILLAFGMMAMYFMSAGKLYLIASLLLIVMSAASLRRKGKPSKLF